jgi:hypothetical protein
MVQLVQKGTVKISPHFSKKTMRNQIPTKKEIMQLCLPNYFESKLIPTDMSVENLKFKLDDNGKKATIDIKKLVLLIRSSKLHRCPNNTFAQRWKISGFADPRNKKKQILESSTKTPGIKSHFDERYNLKSSFDSIG